MKLIDRIKQALRGNTTPMPHATPSSDSSLVPNDPMEVRTSKKAPRRNSIV